MTKYRLSDEPRSFSYLDNGNKKSVLLRQIVALINFNDVRSGTLSGWIDDESALSQSDNCWTYNRSALAFSGATITGNARIIQASVVRDGTQIDDAVQIDRAGISHSTQMHNNVAIRDSVVRSECLLCGDACVVCGSEIVTARRLTRENDQLLQIYDQTTVNNSRVVHQVQIYGDAMINYAFIEHQVEVFDFAWIEGNEENNVWICDYAKVYGHARVIAGTDEGAIPTLRYDSQMAEHAEVEGNCVLKHHVLIGGHTKLRDGPILLDGRILIKGHACILGEVLIEHHIGITGQAQVEAFDGDTIHLRGPKVINGEQRVTHTLIAGLF